jgi:predicted alpha/beta superfamily hydrolase
MPKNINLEIERYILPNNKRVNRYMNSLKSISAVILFLLPLMSVEATVLPSYTMPKTQVLPIKNTVTGGQYELYIKLPEAYAENDDIRYPVIYFTDAVWHIELLSASTEYLMENAILVGISWQKDMNEDLIKDAGAHVSRFRDYSVTKSSKAEVQAKYQFGQASSHLKFIRNDVIKMIETSYRTDPGNRTYFGYSLGGVFGAYTLLAQPDTFKNYILGSPALNGDIPYLSKLGTNTAIKRNGLNANVFISYGSLEKKLAIDAEKFISLLKIRGDKSLSLQHVVVEGNHSQAFPITGIRSVTWLSGLTTDKDQTP